MGDTLSRVSNVTGCVVNDSLEPLEGISVMFNGEEIGSTDMNGEFNITIPSKRLILIFKGDGFETNDVIVDLSDGRDEDLGDIILNKDSGKEKKMQPFQIVLVSDIIFFIIMAAIVLIIIVRSRQK